MNEKEAKTLPELKRMVEKGDYAFKTFRWVPLDVAEQEIQKQRKWLTEALVENMNRISGEKKRLEVQLNFLTKELEKVRDQCDATLKRLVLLRKEVSSRSVTTDVSQLGRKTCEKSSFPVKGVEDGSNPSVSSRESAQKKEVSEK